jgi:hypothetical protein
MKTMVPGPAVEAEGLDRQRLFGLDDDGLRW